MVWSTKYLGKSRDYIVLRHPIRSIDGLICGVKFSRGYCVVEKSSRYYTKLKQLPQLRSVQELPLVHLKTLPFITRDRDVETIFGKDIYVHYLKELEEYLTEQARLEALKQKEQHLANEKLCKFIKDNGEPCKLEASEYSPSGYCLRHILQDPKLEELGIKNKKMLSKDEKREWKEKVIKELKKLKSEGKF